MGVGFVAGREADASPPVLRLPVLNTSLRPSPIVRLFLVGVVLPVPVVRTGFNFGFTGLVVTLVFEGVW